jgi:hypothetical protein
MTTQPGDQQATGDDDGLRRFFRIEPCEDRFGMLLPMRTRPTSRTRRSCSRCTRAATSRRRQSSMAAPTSSGRSADQLGEKKVRPPESRDRRRAVYFWCTRQRCAPAPVAQRRGAPSRVRPAAPHWPEGAYGMGFQESRGQKPAISSHGRPATIASRRASRLSLRRRACAAARAACRSPRVPVSGAAPPWSCWTEEADAVSRRFGLRRRALIEPPRPKLRRRGEASRNRRESAAIGGYRRDFRH